MDEPLSVEALVELQEGHQRRGSDLSPFCDYCEQSWPCDTAYLLASLDAAIEERDELQESLNEAESYAAEGWKWLDDALAALGIETVFDIAGATARSEVLTDALRELLDGMGVEFDDERLGYVSVQVAREDIAAARAALADGERTE